MNNNFCIIMAGGVGSRFWPMSKTKNPKQFLDVLGTGKSLLQQTFERFLPVCPKDQIYIVTNEIYQSLVLEQLPDIDKSQVLLEPDRRNTAPCIAYANYRIALKNPNANIIVAPADHLILNQEEFIRVIKEGLAFTKDNDVLLTLGIKPSRPETGYGYIQKQEGEVNNTPELCKVKTFTEKPDLELAKFFYKSGEFFWNSGLFIWNLQAIDKAFKAYLPEVDNAFAEIKEYLGTDQEEKHINKIYSGCKNISIDYGIMEKAENVYVFCSDFGWSDLGTWGSLYEHSSKDKDQNVRDNNCFLYDVSNTIIKGQENKICVIQGLDDYIVVDSKNALLICRKQDEQRIKQFVNDIKVKKGNSYL